MKIFRGSDTLQGAARKCVLTVGNFDGLHRGHQELLRTVIERGRELGRPTALYTFDPHPRRLLYPERPQPQIMTWAQLWLALEEAGIDIVIRENFTREFASLSADEFLRDILMQRVGPEELFVGRAFHFGKGRRGSGETLRGIGPKVGMRIDVIPQVSLEGEDISSTRIRRLLAEGKVEAAARCLGHPYTIWASVVQGDQRGRDLGFPTANLDPLNELIPRPGVYVSTVRIFDGDRPSAQRFQAVTNIGTRPTFDSGVLLAESHLIDFSGDLYGARVAVEFHGLLRYEERFPGPRELAAQIREDVAQARAALAARPSGLE